MSPLFALLARIILLLREPSAEGSLPADIEDFLANPHPDTLPRVLWLFSGKKLDLGRVPTLKSFSLIDRSQWKRTKHAGLRRRIYARMIDNWMLSNAEESDFLWIQAARSKAGVPALDRSAYETLVSVLVTHDLAGIDYVSPEAIALIRHTKSPSDLLTVLVAMGLTAGHNPNVSRLTRTCLAAHIGAISYRTGVHPFQLIELARVDCWTVAQRRALRHATPGVNLRRALAAGLTDWLKRSLNVWTPKTTI